MPCSDLQWSITQHFLSWICIYSTWSHAQILHKAHSRVGTHSNKLWLYTGNWAKSRLQYLGVQINEVSDKWLSKLPTVVTAVTILVISCLPGCKSEEKNAGKTNGKSNLKLCQVIQTTLGALWLNMHKWFIHTLKWHLQLKVYSRLEPHIYSTLMPGFHNLHNFHNLQY